jgi:hypothetical protein
MSRIGHLSRGLVLPPQDGWHDSVAALSKMSGGRHIARLLSCKGAGFGSGPVAVPKGPLLRLNLPRAPTPRRRVLSSAQFSQRSRDPTVFSCARGRVMDESMKPFVEREDVVHYVEQLKTETDPAKRNVVLKLLAEEVVSKLLAGEEDKQVNAAN